jgi:hypothetical protein
MNVGQVVANVLKREGVGPGIENPFGSIAQGYAVGVPLVVVAGGTPRDRHYMKPYFRSSLNSGT